MMKHPDLAGQEAVYLASSRRAYRGKARNFPMMHSIAVYPKDEEIANLAAIEVRKCGNDAGIF
ncbi:hypothetical protein V2P20_09485 [Methylobacter sp. Wu1]|uniref:c-type cytochrome n=1 Tax=Methylobacter sp. Wu1 TaxID=3119359 RepID=UPI002F936C62